MKSRIPYFVILSMATFSFVHSAALYKQSKIIGPEEKLLKRKIRQVVPTAFKPVCSIGERLNSHNQCVPNFKLPSFSTKSVTRKSTSPFTSSTTTTTSATLEISKSTSTTQSPTTYVDEKLAKSPTHQEIITIIDTSEISSTTISSESRQRGFARIPKEVMPQTQTSFHSETSTQISHSHRHQFGELPLSYKCLHTKDSLPKKFISSAYEDYDY